MNKDNDTRISKKLSYLLRHGAVKNGLNIRADGFINIQDILKNISECTIDDIKRIVENNDKQRFSLSYIDNNLMIKANQGHSITAVTSLNLKLLINFSFDIIHGTYIKCYEKIKSEGLFRMKRNHIHFAKGLNFISGLRKNAEIYIYINIEKATSDGLEFFESENGVILSRGNQYGYIEPKYFLKVVTKSGHILNP